MTNNDQPTILKPDREVGIIGYGAYVPRYRLPASEVARVWAGGQGGTPVKEKSVPGLDEDVVTMSIEAARNALARAGDVDPALIRAVWVGSESHPYAVKPTSTIVAEAIGATPHTQAGDWEFACKAGTEALQAAIGFVGSGMAQYALAIGMDTAQARPGDALEYTASAGGAAYLVGPAEEGLAIFEGSFSYVTDTPDFWRRAYQHYPSHGGRFTGQPAYFKHTIAAAQGLMEGDWDPYAKMEEQASTLGPADFPAAMESQKEQLRELFATVTDEEIASREAELPWGETTSLGNALLSLPFRCLCAYRMQLFLYAKAAGNFDLKTPNCWIGMDMES